MTKTITHEAVEPQQKGSRVLRRAAERGKTTPAESDRIVRKPELFGIVGMSDTSVWRMEAAGQFPKRLRLGGSACGWLLSEINEWLAERAAARG